MAMTAGGGEGGQKPGKAPAPKAPEDPQKWNSKVPGSGGWRAGQETQNWGGRLETEESSGMGSSNGETTEFTCPFLQLSSPFLTS